MTSLIDGTGQTSDIVSSSSIIPNVFHEVQDLGSQNAKFVDPDLERPDAEIRGALPMRFNSPLLRSVIIFQGGS